MLLFLDTKWVPMLTNSLPQMSMQRYFQSAQSMIGPVTIAYLHDAHSNGPKANTLSATRTKEHAWLRCQQDPHQTHWDTNPYPPAVCQLTLYCIGVTRCHIHSLFCCVCRADTRCTGGAGPYRDTKTRYGIRMLTAGTAIQHTRTPAGKLLQQQRGCSCHH